MRKWLLATLLLPFLSLACGAAQGPQPAVCPPADAETAVGTTPQTRPPVELPDSVRQGAQIIQKNYVEGAPDAQALVQAAWAGAREHARRAGDTRELALTSSSNTDEAFRVLAEGAPAGVTSQGLVDAALSAMARSLDDGHTYYRPARLWDVEQRGLTYSLGFEARNFRTDVLITAVYPISPAADARLRPGDVITRFNGVTWDEFTSTGQGAVPGRPLPITYFRQGKEIKALLLARTIPSSQVSAELAPGRVGVVRILQFPSYGCGAVQRFSSELMSSLFALKNQGAEAWVLDLRDNLGGSIGGAARVAGNWGIDPRQAIATITYRSGKTEVFKPDGSSFIDQEPVAVLVNESSASSSEVTASAFKQSGRGRVIGTRTAGSVAVTSPFPVANGALYVTIGHVIGGNLHQLDTVGVTPDQEVPLDLDLLATEGRDSQLEAAVDDLLRSLK